jgi:hypothetical protein
LKINGNERRMTAACQSNVNTRGSRFTRVREHLKLKAFYELVTTTETLKIRIKRIRFVQIVALAVNPERPVQALDRLP